MKKITLILLASLMAVLSSCSTTGSAAGTMKNYGTGLFGGALGLGLLYGLTEVLD